MALPSNPELLKQFDKHKKISESLLNRQHSAAKTCHAFFAGDNSVYYSNGKNGSVLNKIKDVGFLHTVHFHYRIQGILHQ